MSQAVSSAELKKLEMCATHSRTPTIVVLISGSGSNLQALIDAQFLGQLGGATITHVVSNRAAAFGLERAKLANIPGHVFSLKQFCEGDITPQKRQAYDLELAKMLNSFQADLIVLAGWMHIFSASFLNAVQAPVINLHPALPGQFVGAHCIEDAFTAWQKGEITQTGCMVHEVIEQIDAGRVLASQVVPCEAGDTLNDLATRIHAAEHILLVETVRTFCKEIVQHCHTKE